MACSPIMYAQVSQGTNEPQSDDHTCLEANLSQTSKRQLQRPSNIHGCRKMMYKKPALSSAAASALSRGMTGKVAVIKWITHLSLS